MMRSTTFKICVLLAGFAGVPELPAQLLGDYRTQQSGNWHDLSSWARFDGANWIAPVLTTPVTGDGAVTILTGHTITLTATDSVDQLTIDAGGKLLISSGVTLNIEDGAGTDAVVNDSLLNAGSITLDAGAELSFESGGVYAHAQNGGLVPSATWNAGSTCLISGVTSNAPSNLNQNFHHFTWDCAGQSSNLDWGWYYNTVSGDVTVSSTGGGSSRIRMTSPGASPAGDNLITIQGNITVTDANLESNGSSSADTITVVSMGNITVNGGVFAVSRGSGPMVRWNHHGDLTVLNAELRNSGGTKVSFVFAANGTQNVGASGLTYSGSFHMTVDTNSTVVITDGPDAVDLPVNGTLTNIGTITATGGMTFQNGATYVHARNGGSIPTAIWESGSTCRISGVTANAPGNANQNYHHFTWDCPGQTGNLNLAWNNNIIGGDLTCANTGSGRFQMTNSTFSGTEIGVLGNVIVTGGTLTSNGSSGAATYAVTVLGNVTVTGGNLSLSRGSGGVATWNLSGDFSVSDATLQTSNSSSKYVFAGQGIQSISLSNVTYTSANNFEVASGSVLDMGNATLGGSGDFTADSSSTVHIWNSGGLDATFQNTGAKAFSRYSNLVFDGVSAQVVGASPPDTLASLTFSNPAGVALNDSISCSLFVVAAGTPVTIDTLGFLSADTGSVGGSVVCRGTLASSTGLFFSNGSSYEHARNTGSIPNGGWSVGSTCTVTGTTGGNKPSNLNQNFHDFVWNTPGQTGNLDWGWFENTISGDITIMSTGSARAQMTSPGASPFGPNLITINGTIFVQDGQFTSNGSSGADTIVIDTYGNVVVTGGNFSVSRGSGPNVVWKLYGDLSMSNATTQNSGSTKTKFVFSKAGTQKLSLSSVSFGGGGIPIEIAPGSTVQLDSSVIGGAGSFTSTAGSGLTTTHILGLNGNIATTGTVTLSSQSNVTYNGTAPQVTGALLPLPVMNLTIDNPAGVTLSATASTDDALILQNGVLSLGAFSMIADSVQGGSSTSYVRTDGSGVLTTPLVGATMIHFPVGSGSYAPVWIQNNGTVDNFNVSVAEEASAAPFGGRVNVKWTISENAPGGSQSTVRFGWMGSAESAAFAANRAGNARIYLLGTSDTTETGAGAYTQQFSAEPYSISRGSVSTFGSFVVGAFNPVTSVESTEELPKVFALRQNFPNPFNPSTRISFDVPIEAKVTLEVFDLLGRRVTTLFDGVRQAGTFETTFEASNLPSGIYMCRLSTPSGAFTRRLVLMK